MFNIGIVAGRSRPPPPTIRLTSREVVSTFMVDRHGRLYVDGYISGEWNIAGYVQNIRDQFEYRTTVQSGGPLNTGAMPDWGVFHISSTGQIGLGGGARFLLELREISKPSNYASAQFWTSGFAP